ncbi:peptide methionine sulfoxide reductase MsrB [Trichinella spiralis]|uniref:peptide methionine sulfoxide reductase MsrB n=1 Tax=Trichinella spiralis TaxID=6334 RepID=UPI0001EFD2EC|nr:peptide methionine sulfoxide reductase MsrB [Trichinella spiralis]
MQTFIVEYDSVWNSRCIKNTKQIIHFSASTKFDSNCGWPSFFDAEESSVITRNDFSNNMVRTEVLCKACHAHLGHLFSDGPKPSGMRYCINGIALNFKPSSETQASAAADDDQSKN